jgi:methylenetetrahydrofolate--tRNA-(uracil-5-)-methyltransferase
MHLIERTSGIGRDMTDREVIIIGGGLAGTEASWQLAQRGHHVRLYEMRPVRETGAHVSDRLAELVCSNSFGSKLPDRASGLLKTECQRLGCLLLDIADATAVPAGGALAVDREAFAQRVTYTIASHPRITLIREEMPTIPNTPTIIASGPLTSDALSAEIARLSGSEYLYFYDAISPIVTLESIDFTIAFRASRYERGDEEEGDYINCPMNRDEYEAFVDALIAAETIELKQFEREDPHFFEGCLPIEQIAARGRESLAFGPMRPIGLRDPRTGKRPHAVVQLRKDNLIGTLYNIVGFQTNLKWGDQKRILQMIPGLQTADFVRYGMMHRNTFINAPTLLYPTMQFRGREDLLFAGQITGVEGYMGNVASGLLAGLNMARLLEGQPLVTLPPTTMLGALCHYVTHAEPNDFQPMKANFGIMPPLEPHIKDKRVRYQGYVTRALAHLDQMMAEAGITTEKASGETVAQ